MALTPGAQVPQPALLTYAKLQSLLAYSPPMRLLLSILLSMNIFSKTLKSLFDFPNKNCTHLGYTAR